MIIIIVRNQSKWPQVSKRKDNHDTDNLDHLEPTHYHDHDNDKVPVEVANVRGRMIMILVIIIMIMRGC